MQSVTNAITNAYAMLEDGGNIILRDMILPERMKQSSPHFNGIMQKIRDVPAMLSLLTDFELAHGPIQSLYQANHFLLKYFYTDNWERECKENYVPVTNEEYEGIFDSLGAQVTHNEFYCIPYLREKWQKDFGLDDDELAQLYSTRIMVAQKGHESPDGSRPQP